MRPEPTPEQRTQMGAAGVAAGLGCSIVVTLLLLIGGGLLLDRVLGTEPILTLIGVALGLVAAGYQLYELTRIGVSGREPGPIGRRLSGVSGHRRTTSRDVGGEE